MATKATGGAQRQVVVNGHIMKLKVMTHEQCIAAAKHSLRPGHYNWEGMPASRREQSGNPEVFHSGSWHPVEDYGAFMHQADRIPKKEFVELLKRHGGSL